MGGTAAGRGTRAQGRATLIWVHTECSSGFGLPIAVDRDTNFAFRPRADTLVHIVSDHGEHAEFDLADLLRAVDV